MKEVGLIVEVSLMNEVGLVVQINERKSEVLFPGWLTSGVGVLRMV